MDIKLYKAPSRISGVGLLGIYNYHVPVKGYVLTKLHREYLMDVINQCDM